MDWLRQLAISGVEAGLLSDSFIDRKSTRLNSSHAT